MSRGRAYLRGERVERSITVAKSKSRPDKDLYERLRNSGVRKKAAKQVSRVMPGKKNPGTKAAERVANDLSSAVTEIRDRVTGGSSKKRSEAAKKAARTRKANQKKRSQTAKKAAKTRKKS
jgi:hypothetical protein